MRETMNAHRALCELKMLNDRINDKIDRSTLVVANKHSNQKIAGVAISDFAANAKAEYQSIRTLINRRNAIKRALTQSNATTKVTIDGVEYTVAEAIDMKTVGLAQLKALLAKLDNQYGRAVREADMANGDSLEERADKYIASVYGNSDMKNMSEDLRKVRESFIEAQRFDVIDPINCVKEIEALRAQIDNFIAEVDSALSVANALTTIEVEYETV